MSLTYPLKIKSQFWECTSPKLKNKKNNSNMTLILFNIMIIKSLKFFEN